MNSVKRILLEFASKRTAIIGCLLVLAVTAWASDSPRRSLRVALYPFVPLKAELYLKVLQDYSKLHPEIDLQLVDLTANYYTGGLSETLKNSVDVAEVDTVFLQDMVSSQSVEELPGSESPTSGTYVPLAASAVMLNDKVYGVPHWICGDFLFFRRDDAAADQLKQARTLKDLEKIFGAVTAPGGALMADLCGKSTLGEFYLHALLDQYQSPGEALKHVDSEDDVAVDSIKRLCALCPGGLDHWIKAHIFGQFDARQFTHERVRAIICYSEGLHDVLDEYLHGVSFHEPAVGQIYKFDSSSMLRNSHNLAEEMGNSVTMVRTYYDAAVSPSVAKLWWKIRVARPKNVVPIKAAA
jgi:thiamine pyridinylase